MNLNLIKGLFIGAIYLCMPFKGYTQTDCDNDTVPPLAICFESVSVTLDAGLATVTADMVDAGSFDNCEIASISVSQSDFDCTDISIDLQQFVKFSEGPIPVEILGKDGFLSFSGNNGYNSIEEGFTSNMVEFYTEEINNLDPSVYCVELKVNNFVNIVSMQFALEFDNSYLAYNGSNNVSLSEFTEQNVGVVNSNLGVSWVSQNIIDGETISDGSTLFSICFDVLQVNEASTVLVVSDVSGNTSSCVTMVEVIDDQSPIILCDSNPVVLDISSDGSALLNPDDVLFGISDDCEVSSFAFGQAYYDCSDFYLKEKLAPYFLTNPLNPEVITLNGNNDFKGTSYYNELTLSNGDTGLESVFNIEESSNTETSACFEISVTEFNSVVGLQFALAYDENSLQFESISSVLSVFSNSNYSIPAPGIISVSWNSADLSLGESYADDTALMEVCFEKSVGLSIENSLTISDLSGNQSTCSFIVEVNDDIDPVLDLNNIVIDLDENGILELGQMDLVELVSDNCGVAAINFMDQISLSCSDIAEVPDVAIQLADQPAVIELINNQGEFVSLLDIVSGDTLAQGTSDQTVGLSISQTAGSEAYQVCYDFLVQDFENMVAFQLSIDFDDEALSYTGLGSSDLSYFSNQNINLTPAGELIVAWTSLDVENGVSVPLGFNLFSVCFDYLGSIGIPLEVEAVDYFGNTTNGTAYVIVEDNLGPNLICEDSKTVSLDQDGFGYLTTNDLVLEASDNCSSVSLASEQYIFNCDDIGIYTYEIEAFDDYGNASSCSVVVEIKDNITPVLDCQPLVITDINDGVAIANPADAVQTLFDNCDLVNVSLSETIFDCSSILDNQLEILQSVDNDVIVEFANSDQNILNTGITLNGETTIYGSGTEADLNLEILPAGVVSSAGIYCYDLRVSGFTNMISFQFGLNFDNSSTSYLSILPVDLEDDINFNTSEENGLISILWFAQDLVNGVSIDNGGVLASLCFETENDFSLNTVEVTATDVWGNSSICETTVSVLDNNSPQALCSDLNISLNADIDNYFEADLFDNGSFDNCCLDNLSVSRSNPICDEIFDFTNSVLFCEEDLGQDVTVLLKVTDCSGNSSICESFVSVSETYTDVVNVELNEFEVHLYPNPVKDLINIELDLEVGTAAQIRLLSLEGRILSEQQLIADVDRTEVVISTENLKSGIYFVEIVSSSGVWSKKITKI
jgi:hypothetical protein